MDKQTGLCKLDHYGLIHISGQAAEHFLQVQSTSDLNQLAEQSSTFSACCDRKGRVQVFFRIFKTADGFYLRLPKTMIPYTLALFEQYAQFSDLELKDCSQDFIGIGLITDQFDSKTFNLNQTLWFKTIGTPERFEIFIPNIGSNLLTDLSKTFKPIEKSIWEQLEIQAHIPEIYPETIEKFLPHHIGLPKLGALSLNKGCYRGQEIIVRMAHRGKIKRTLASKTINTQGSIQPGEYFSDQRVVRSVQMNPKQARLLLEIGI